MNRQPVEIGLPRERASATPRDVPRGKLPAGQRAVPGAAESTSDASLRGSQTWFASAVMAPASEDVTEAAAACRLTAGPRLSALERLGIYRRAYCARLIECLADDYPVLHHALGEDAFDGLCRAYIERHPSRDPNLNGFGRFMEAFCREGALPAGQRVFGADLAALEWAIVEVIHAPSSPPLTLEGLREIPMEQWAGASLVANTAVRLLRLQYPANAYFQAVRDEKDPPMPEARASTTAVYRSGATVWRMELTEAMYAALSSLVEGVALGESLERACEHMGNVEEAEAAERVMDWFREWIASGLFSGVRAG